jgi:hypothetical protein
MSKHIILRLFDKFKINKYISQIIARYWRKLVDWYFYKKIQQNYPRVGKMCTFNSGSEQIPCIVLSNSFGNGLVILQELKYQSAYLIISYGFVKKWWKLWIPLPIWVWAFVNSSGYIDQLYFNSDLYVFQKYFLTCDQVTSSKSMSSEKMQTMDVIKYIDSFDIFLKTQDFWWFVDDFANIIRTKDWLIEKSRMIKSATIIQKQWHKSITCPEYKLCRRRLTREFNELF